MLSALLLLLACAAPQAWGGQGGAHQVAGRNPSAHLHRRARAARLLGTAFHTRGGAGEIVIQTSGEVELEAHGEGADPVFILKRCRVLRPNDRRPLDTRFFDSPVTGITLRRRGVDLRITVSLRAPSTTVPRKERGPGDSWYWVLSFAPVTTADQTLRASHTTAANP